MIKQAIIDDSYQLASLAVMLWPHNELKSLEKDFLEYISENKGAIFLAFKNEVPIGFAQASLRHDYVEGTKSSPVGYMEGIFVKEDFRKIGIARNLLESCESWARKKGCSEFASDCELTNIESLDFHLNLGFEEANRIICFKKKI